LVLKWNSFYRIEGELLLAVIIVVLLILFYCIIYCNIMGFHGMPSFIKRTGKNHGHGPVCYLQLTNQKCKTVRTELGYTIM